MWKLTLSYYKPLSNSLTHHEKQINNKNKESTDKLMMFCFAYPFIDKLGVGFWCIQSTSFWKLQVGSESVM